jgi:hypothetical protein
MTNAKDHVTSKERRLLDRAVDVMSAFHRAIEPEEEDPELAGRISPAALRTFVDALADIDRERCRLPVETPDDVRALFNKGIGALKDNRFSFSFNGDIEAAAAFHYIAKLGALETGSGADVAQKIAGSSPKTS